MEENNNKKKSKKIRDIFAGIAIGGAIGSILGLTLAPKKGKETREMLKEKSKNLYDKGKGMYEKHKGKECCPFGAKIKKWLFGKKDKTKVEAPKK